MGPVLQPVLSRLKILVSSASKKKTILWNSVFTISKNYLKFLVDEFFPLAFARTSGFFIWNCSDFLFQKAIHQSFPGILPLRGVVFLTASLGSSSPTILLLHFQLASPFIHMFLVPQLGVVPPLITLLASTSQNGQTYSNNLLPKTNELYLNIVWSWYLKVKNRF